jgi:uncharacterized protein YecT (DUF1311 family)
MSVYRPLGSIIIAIAIATPATARAQLRRPAHACAGMTSQQQANICVAGVADTLTARLDSLLAGLHRALPKADWERVDETERRWSGYAESQCAFERSRFEGGTIAPSVGARCAADLITARIARLRPYLCDPAGLKDSCPAARRYDALPQP